MGLKLEKYKPPLPLHTTKTMAINDVGVVVGGSSDGRVVARG